MLFWVVVNLFTTVWHLMLTLVGSLVFLIASLKLLSFFIKPWSRYKYTGLTNQLDKLNPYFTIGFFHPFCHSGGGGERVLWSAIQILQKK